MRMEKEYIELVDLAALLKDGIESVCPAPVWVKAEISGLSRKQNGHCYLDLSQSGGGVILAKVRGTIWASRWNYVDQYFRSVTGTSMAVGMEILFRAQVNYHPLFGLSLNIDEVDPEFTLGVNERQKRLTMERLTKEGLMDVQKELCLPELPYSLAVISAPGAAGFGDFRRHLLENEYGFVFDVTLFEALMQGEQAADSMIMALEEITSSEKSYDAVLIMRGGGSEFDLACFDDYDLAVAIARCPIPVFTAIGHDRDFHVADMVAHTFVKTPTALADLFLDCYIAEDQRISSYESRLRLAFSGRVNSMASGLDILRMRVLHSASRRLDDALHKLEMLDARITSGDPRIVLEKGFALVLDGAGVKLTTASAVKVGDPIRIMLADGTITGGVTGVDIKKE